MNANQLEALHDILLTIRRIDLEFDLSDEELISVVQVTPIALMLGDDFGDFLDVGSDL